MVGWILFFRWTVNLIRCVEDWWWSGDGAIGFDLDESHHGPTTATTAIQVTDKVPSAYEIMISVHIRTTRTGK